MRRRRPTAEAGGVPDWVAQSPRLIVPADGGPPRPNATWEHLAGPGDGPGQVFAVRARWRDEGRAWCAERGLIYAAARCGRAVPGHVDDRWSPAG